jgi:ActR/RegA family two-component response regulator
MGIFCDRQNVCNGVESNFSPDAATALSIPDRMVILLVAHLCCGASTERDSGIVHRTKAFFHSSAAQDFDSYDFRAVEGVMLKILIVEDDALLAVTLKHMIETNPFYNVTAIAPDFLGALEAVAEMVPDLALVDLKLANESNGLNVASKLQDMDVLCLFMTGDPPNIPVPELALGCLSKPFDEAALAQALSEAEDVLRDHQKLVRKLRLPAELQLYGPSVEGRLDGSEPAEAIDAVDSDLEHLNPTQSERIGMSLIERIWAAVRGKTNPLQSVPAMNVDGGRSLDGATA